MEFNKLIEVEMDKMPTNATVVIMTNMLRDALGELEVELGAPIGTGRIALKAARITALAIAIGLDAEEHKYV